MDRRALNALRKRRADKHMIAFLIFLGIVAIVAGAAVAVVIARNRGAIGDSTSSGICNHTKM